MYIATGKYMETNIKTMEINEIRCREDMPRYGGCTDKYEIISEPKLK